MTLSNTLRALRDARNTGNQTLIAAAQRLFDKARIAEQQSAAHQERQRRIVNRLDNLNRVLNASENVRYKDVPVGLCTHERAVYLMGAASMAGGAVFVACPPIEGLNNVIPGYIAMGKLPSGDDVPNHRLDPAVIARMIRTQVRRWATPCSVLMLEDEIGEALHVLLALEAESAS